jgi:superfamily II DNA/RNA helicase
VAARGLDLSAIDWIVQYNPPVTAEEYVHRVGRTARVGKCGQAIIFLAPPETDFVHRLANRGIRLGRFPEKLNSCFIYRYFLQLCT